VKILNLYAGIGGNRKLWGDEHQITAVELNPQIASIYQDFFPHDQVVLADAHQYLLEHYAGFDFIWSSPPCPTHSRIRNVAGVGRGQNEPVYPDMALYQEIIFLNQVYNSSGTDFHGRFVVENVISYYKPLIRPQVFAKHYWWANFPIAEREIATRGHHETENDLQEIKGFDLTRYEGINKRLLLRNCVEPHIGKHILDWAMKPWTPNLTLL
jgi:DNA (cytosine-5)-methyltransferase 1